MPSAKATTTDIIDGEIDAMPTKELFIEMLTRDITLIPAILDLADNSADGARKLKGDGSFDGFSTKISVGPDKFEIADNCGGFDDVVARKYAFRFGRAPDAPSVKHSVGQFGVGMKRAIFKMGKIFRVESTTAKTRFVVAVNVEEWAKRKDWHFEFAELETNRSFPKDQCGTRVTVTSLRPDVAETFGLETFVSSLKAELQSKLQDPITRGLYVTLNSLPVSAEPMTILSSDALAPASVTREYKATGKKPVTVKLFCGIGRSTSKRDERVEAGWNVYCNGRLILEGDKTALTGWGDEEDTVSIPSFHGQYNALRGFAYFDSDDPARLPWNTTKTSLNTDSAIYRAVKPEMMLLMRPVVDFLNRLKEEKQAKNDPDEKGPLESFVDDAKLLPVASAGSRPVFTAPQVKPKAKPPGPQMQRIQYDAPLAEVLKAKRVLRASSYKEVGEKTFRYFYDAEVDE